MKYRHATTLLITLILFTVASLTAGAQDLFRENEHYKEAQELRREAEQALEEGDYDRATELSEQVRELTEKARSFAEKQVRIYKARGWKNRAEDFIRWAEGIGAEERYPDRWEEASDSYDEAGTLFDEEEWDESIKASRNTISLVEEMEPRSDVKPRYYEVREIPENRDCFWRIAAYDFVYDDPWKWEDLYEANRDKIPDPDNPSLIKPGTVLEIPSIDGEERSGTWSPED
ncbi:MAG: hypothetical protein ACLFSA_04850 [Spirochaetaceae bacterium]